MTSLLLILAVVGAPAMVLRVLCLGRACAEPTNVASTVPFCSLPDGLRSKIAAGFREGRSADVLGVTGASAVLGGTGRAHSSVAPWPSKSGLDDRVPIVFSGVQLEPDVLPAGSGLDDIAPTLAELLGYERPHPRVRSGEALGELDAPEQGRPELILVVVWKGIGTADLQGRPSEWPALAELRALGPDTFAAETGALPLDPAAGLTTIGTGGLPYQHGITSEAVLNDEGRLVRAWSKDAPVSVIASLADDWDAARRQEPLIGLVATESSDRGIIGGNWYVDSDTDRVSIVPREDVLTEALAELKRGYGSDGVADILAVVDEGPIGTMDSNLEELTRAAGKVTERLVVVVSATGSVSTDGSVVPASDVTEDVERAVPGRRRVVQAAAPGGLYLDQDTVAAEGITDDEVIAALEAVRSPGGGRLMDQVFPGLAVSFARYC